MNQSLKKTDETMMPLPESDNLISLAQEADTAEIEKRNLHSQIGRMHEKHNELSKLTTDFGEQAKHLTGKIVDMQDKFNVLTERLDGVEKTTGDLTQTSEHLLKKTKTLIYKTDDLIKSTDQLEKKTEALSKANEAVKSRVDVLEPKSDDLFTRTDALTAQSAALDQRTDLLHHQFKKALWMFAVLLSIVAIAGASTIFYTNWQMNRIKPEIIAHVSQNVAQDLQKTDAQLQKEIARIDNQIVLLEQSRQSLANQLGVMGNDVADMNQRITAEEQVTADVKKVLKESSILFTDINTKNWVAEQPRSNWTIQLMCATAEKGAVQFINAYDYHEPLAYYKTIYKNQEWFVVMAGSFASREEAGAAAKLLPEALKVGKPWIRSFADIQGRIDKYNLRANR